MMKLTMQLRKRQFKNLCRLIGRLIYLAYLTIFKFDKVKKRMFPKYIKNLIPVFYVTKNFYFRQFKIYHYLILARGLFNYKGISHTFKLENLIRLKGYKHPLSYNKNVKKASFRPIITAAGLFRFRLSLVGYLNNRPNCFKSSMVLAIFLLFFAIRKWLKLMQKENNRGYYIKAIQRNFRLAYILFIISEALLFRAFFWAFFHSSVTPTLWVGCTWPPIGVGFAKAPKLAILNTIILSTSAIRITLAHKYIRLNEPTKAFRFFDLTFLRALMFSTIQYAEFMFLSFSIHDGILGSTFYALTGLHAFHVAVGTILLYASYRQFKKKKLSQHSHFLLESSIWYWHFVDIVWVILFLSVYEWGSAESILQNIVQKLANSSSTIETNEEQSTFQWLKQKGYYFCPKNKS